MIDADEILNAIGDDVLHNIVVKSAAQMGVELDDGQVAKVVEAIKAGVRQACAEVGRESNMRAFVQRETQRFMRQCGIRRF